MRLLEGLFTKIYFLMKLAMLHLVLSLCGGVVFGVAPASATVLFLYREHGRETEQYRLTQAFSYFKKQFIQTNLMALLLLGAGLVLGYSIWFSSQFLPHWWAFFALISQFLLVVYVVSMYSLYLTLQVYYEFSLSVALKLVATGLFLDWTALSKWWLGTGLCLFFAWRFPLLLAIFLPTVWLLFTFDSLEPIYQQIEKRSS